ncbi:MAG TPA: peptide chain release factor N(5)-glutamine methyltransferase [Rhodocyclaceae bacterium]
MVAATGTDGTVTVREAVDAVRRRIARLDARLLVQHIVGIGHAEFLAHPERRLSHDEANAFMALVNRRANGEPLAYLTGEREFFGRSFAVTADVLIPRPDTERLVLAAIEVAEERGGEAAILDLGTGSGAIAVTLALELPGARLTATDLSAAALTVAGRNAAVLGATVSFVASDWYAALGPTQFDLIVSNPPYVAAGDPHLAQDGLPFEPDLALTDGGDGLACLREIIAGAPAFLAPGGQLLLEHGYDQAAAVRALLARAGFIAIASRRDLSGHERVSGGRWQPPA